MKAKLRCYQSWESLLYASEAISIMGCCAMGYAPALAIATFVTINPVNAQIVPDNTLLVNSSVAPGCTACTIEGGTVRGSNLFHSFSEFSVPTGGEAFFNNDATLIQNIFTRVTGNSASNIDGLIRANGTANLFLINPNGIVFNSNASLNIGGSFIASTANSLNFSDRIKFSTVNSQTPLLTINVPIGLEFGTNPGSIQVLGSSLEVNPGQTLALVGGNVQLNGGQLLTEGGNVELGGIADTGTVDLSINGSDFGLSFPDGVERSDVSLSNGTNVNVLADAGGSIAINARSLDIESTQLQSGIASGLGSVDSQAGDIEINATEAISLNGSRISNRVESEAVGNSGDINITTGSLSLKDSAFLVTSTSGVGNAGNVTVRAKNAVDLADNAGILSTVNAGGVGKGGNIDINAATLSLIDGAQLATITRQASATQPAAQGNAGNVNLLVTGAVNIAGEKNNINSGIFSFVAKGTVGNGGNILINSGSFSLRDGAFLEASTFGNGNAGNVIVGAKNAVDLADAYIFSTVSAGSVGQGGNIDINAESLSVTNGGQLVATNYGGKGDAGSIDIVARDTIVFDKKLGDNPTGAFSNILPNGEGDGASINITTGSLYLKNGAVLNVAIYGKGNAGSVNIVARDTVSFDGVSANGTSATGVVSAVDTKAKGKGGNINITAGSLFVSNGALLTATTSGEGNAGNVNIVAQNTVSLEGAGKNGILSGAYSTVESTGLGKGGNINITTGMLSLKDGASLSVRTRGEGDGGNITLRANTLEAISGGQFITTSNGSGNAGNITLDVTDSITLSGSNANYFARIDQFIAQFRSNEVLSVDPASGLFANTSETSTGRGGELTINTKQFYIRDGAQVTVSSQGSGIAGSLLVEANSIYLDNKAKISADTKGGQGNINLRSRDFLLLRRGSSITTDAKGNATGGNITINTNSLVAVPEEDSDISANAEENFGGRVIVNASGIFGTEFRLKPTPLSDITASSALGSEFNGVVQLNISDVNPSQSLTALPTNIIDTSQLIANSCIARSKRPEGKFIVTGNGGLPVMPDDPSIAPYQTYQIPTVQSASISTLQENLTTSNKPYHSVKSAPLIEAQGWMYGSNGEVILTASPPTIAPHSSWLQLSTCSGS